MRISYAKLERGFKTDHLFCGWVYSFSTHLQRGTINLSSKAKKRLANFSNDKSNLLNELSSSSKEESIPFTAEQIYVIPNDYQVEQLENKDVESTITHEQSVKLKNRIYLPSGFWLYCTLTFNKTNIRETSSFNILSEIMARKVFIREDMLLTLNVNNKKEFEFIESEETYKNYNTLMHSPWFSLEHTYPQKNEEIAIKQNIDNNCSISHNFNYNSSINNSKNKYAYLLSEENWRTWEVVLRESRITDILTSEFLQKPAKKYSRDEEVTNILRRWVGEDNDHGKFNDNINCRSNAYETHIEQSLKASKIEECQTTLLDDTINSDY